MSGPRPFSSLSGKFPIAVLAFTAVVTIFLAAGIPNLAMRPFFEGDLPSNDPIVRANERYSSYFGKDEVAFLALVNDTIYSPTTLAKIADITEELNSLDDVLEEETLSLATARRVRWREWGLDVRRYLSPLPRTPEEIERLRQDVRLDSEVYDRLVSRDETSTLFAIKLRPGYDHRRLYRSLHAIADRYSGPERIYPFGHQVMSEEANLGIQHDARILGPAALALMAAGLLVFFRSVKLTLGPIIMVTMSIVWTMGIMHYIGFPLSMLSSSIPAVLIALGSSYMIHVIYSCGEQPDPASTAEAVTEGVKKIAPPIMLAAGTSMVGFLTLTVFRVLSIREFGVCVALGIGFAAFLSLLVLPSIIILQKCVFKAGRGPKLNFLDKLLRGLTRTGLEHRYVVTGMGIILVLVSLRGISKIRVGYAPEEIFPKNHRAREVVSLFIKEFNGPYSINVMFDSNQPDGLKSPELLEKIVKFQNFAEGLPHVKYATSMVDIVKRMNRILNEDDPKFYRVPESESMIAQLLLVHSLTRDPAQSEALMDYDMQRCKVAVATTAIDSVQLEAIFDKLAAYCEENFRDNVAISFGGRSLIWMAQNHYIIRGKILNIIANTILIWIICAFAFRSVRLGLISIAPLSIATLATFGLMGYLGIRLDTATAVLTGISVGVGVDFAIHFISRLKRESLHTDRIDEAMDITMIGAGRAIIFDATSNILGFVTFIFSGFTPVRNLGLLICFTMISCVLLTLLFIPTIIALVPVPFRHPAGATVFLSARPDEKEVAHASEPAE